MNAQLSPIRQGSRPAFNLSFVDNSQLKRVPRSPNFTSASNPKSKGASNPAHLILSIQHRMPKALTAMRCRVERRWHESQHEGGLLLIPSKVLPSQSQHKTKPKHKKVNRTKPKKSQLKLNRKLPSLKGFIIHNGTSYKVNTGDSETLPIYNVIVKRMIDQLDICLDKWGRVYAVRIDLHQKNYRGDNKLMSRFICNFRKRMFKEYGFNDFGYQWARESETVKVHHYHLVLFFNGKQINSIWHIRKLAREVWEKIWDGNTVPYWNTNRKSKADHGIRADDHQAKADAIYHFSYLAKIRGKGYRDTKAKDYCTSQIPKRVRLTT